MILVESKGSVAERGVWYLANQSTFKGLPKRRRYLWGCNNEDYHCAFKTLASAKMALTKLLKVCDEFRDDEIRFLDFETLEEVER